MSRDDTLFGTVTRRRLLGHLPAVGATLGLSTAALGRSASTSASTQTGTTARVITNGRIRQSVCRWCYMQIPLEELAVAAKEMGLESVEILDPEDFSVLQKHGLACAMVNSHSIPKGINDPANHEECLEKIRRSIDAASEAGFPNVITFSGNRNGMSDAVGLENSARALGQIVGYAESKNVTICMEALNSKVDHLDYMADNMPWSVALVERVGSDHFKILYDIYHMQIMEGDVIRTIRDFHEFIAHYHTAGNPGRHELDDRQELFYPAIVNAILETGYTGYLGQEFIPTGDDPLASLAAGVRVCDV